MLDLDENSARHKATSGLLLGIVGISLFVAIPSFFLITSSASPFSAEPSRTVVVVVIVGVWLGGVASLVSSFRRDLTPVRLTDQGILAGTRFITYPEIEAVDREEGKLIFRVRLRDSGKVVALSKIGIAREADFFNELHSRISSES